MLKKELSNYKKNLVYKINSINFYEIDNLSKKIIKIWKKKKNYLFVETAVAQEILVILPTTLLTE